DHRDVAEVAVAEIECEIVPHHQQEALVNRLVEAELLLELLDEFRIDALAADLTHARSADPRRCFDVGSLDLRDHPLDRPPRRELDDRESHEHDSDQRRYHQQQPLEDVKAQGYGPRRKLAAFVLSIHQLVMMPRSYFGLTAGRSKISQ